MPLWLAWVFALVLNTGSALWVLFTLGDTRFDQIAFVSWLFVPAALVPAVARYKRRRFFVWSAVSLFSLLLGLFEPVFQPMACLIALLFAERVAYKAPERELEAAEDPKAMRRLLAIREALWPTYQQAEDRYMHRDYATLTTYDETLDALDSRLKDTHEQKSQRGQNVRLHLNAALQELRIVGSEAEAVLEATADSPELASLAGQGGAMPTKNKPAKNLAKHVRKIEQMLNHARVQLGVAGGILDALGYTPDALPPASQATVADNDAHNNDDDLDADAQPLPSPPTASRPRPRRPVRRRRH